MKQKYNLTLRFIILQCILIIFVWIGSSIANTNCDDIIDVPIAYWGFDKGEGNIAVEGTSNAYHGTISGASWTTGKSGSALGFNGSGNYVDMGDILDPGTNDMSVEYWVKTTSSGSYWRTVQKRGSGGNYVAGWQISGFGNNFGNTFYCDGAGNYVKLSGANHSVNDGQWHHIVVTWENSTANLKLYVDGVYKETGRKGGTPQGMNINTTKPFTLGSSWDSASSQTQFFNGDLDDIVIYNKTLSSTEVLKRYSGE